jgi:hypothetical protein
MKQFYIPLTVLALLWLTGFYLFSDLGARNSNSSTDLLYTAGNPVTALPLVYVLKKKREPVKPPQEVSLQTRKTRTRNVPVKKTDVLLDRSSSLFVRPPVQAKNVKFLSFTVKPGEGITWKHPVSGTTIVIPPGALVYADGTPVKEDVTISYREFTTPSEIFLSGIPMKWKDGNYLESGGMMEIRASVGDREVFVKKGSALTLAMESAFTDRDYNLYTFNETKGTWEEEKQKFQYANVVPVNKNADAEIIRNGKTESIGGYIDVVDSVALTDIAGFGLSRETEASIVKPALLHLSYEWQYFPELQNLGAYTYRSVNYTYNGLEQVFNANLRSVAAEGKTDPRVYDDIHILYPGSKGPVDIVFSDGPKQFIIGVEPVLKQQRWQEKFIREYTEYSRRYDSAFAHRRFRYFKKKQYVADFSQIRDEKLKQQVYRDYYDEKVMRTFTTNKFGIINCDRPVNINGEIIVNARFFLDGDGNRVREVYLADLKRNSIVNSMAQHFKRFRYSVADDNMIWTVLPDNKVGYLMPDDLAAITPVDGSADFHLKQMPVDDFVKMMDGKFEFFEKKNRADLVVKR